MGLKSEVVQANPQKVSTVAIVMPVADKLTGKFDQLIEILRPHFGPEYAQRIYDVLSNAGWNQSVGGWLPFAKALNLIVTKDDFPHNDWKVAYAYHGMSGGSIANQRNAGVEVALNMGAEYVWFQDWDVQLPLGAFGVLYSQELPIISGTYMMKQWPARTMAMAGPNNHFYDTWWKKKYKIGGVHSGLSIVPSGCLLVKAEVLRRIDPPWFTDGSGFIADADRMGEATSWTDDATFSAKAIEAGYTLHLHTGVQCDHWDIHTGIVYGFDPEREQPAWRHLGAGMEWQSFAKEVIAVGDVERFADGAEGEAGGDDGGALDEQQLEPDRERGRAAGIGGREVPWRRLLHRFCR